LQAMWRAPVPKKLAAKKKLQSAHAAQTGIHHPGCRARRPMKKTSERSEQTRMMERARDEEKRFQRCSPFAAGGKGIWGEVRI